MKDVKCPVCGSPATLEESGWCFCKNTACLCAWSVMCTDKIAAVTAERDALKVAADGGRNGGAPLPRQHAMTTFFLPMERVPTVTAQQGHRTTKTGRHYTDQRALDARALYRALLAPHAPADPLSGPVRLLVKFLFPLNGHADGEYKITKPDTDNMIKILKDAMSDAGFWSDDAQVASETVEKFYSKITGVFVSVCVIKE